MSFAILDVLALAPPFVGGGPAPVVIVQVHVTDRLDFMAVWQDAADFPAAVTDTENFLE